MLCPPFCLCRAGVAWSVRYGGLLAASLSRSALLVAPPSLCAALSGCRRWCALACAAVVLFCLASRFRSAPQDEAKTKNNYAVRGLAAARPLSAALAASAVVSAIVRGTAPACGLPLLAPVRRVPRLRSVYTLYHERLFVSCILNTICHFRGLTCIH